MIPGRSAGEIRLMLDHDAALLRMSLQRACQSMTCLARSLTPTARLQLRLGGGDRTRAARNGLRDIFDGALDRDELVARRALKFGSRSSKIRCERDRPKWRYDVVRDALSHLPEARRSRSAA